MDKHMDMDVALHCYTGEGFSIFLKIRFRLSQINAVTMMLRLYAASHFHILNVKCLNTLRCFGWAHREPCTVTPVGNGNYTNGKGNYTNGNGKGNDTNGNDTTDNSNGNTNGIGNCKVDGKRMATAMVLAFTLATTMAILCPLHFVNILCWLSPCFYDCLCNCSSCWQVVLLSQQGWWQWQTLQPQWQPRL